MKLGTSILHKTSGFWDRIDKESLEIYFDEHALNRDRGFKL